MITSPASEIWGTGRPRKTTEVARITAVYRGRPSVERGPLKTADWP